MPLRVGAEIGIECGGHGAHQDAGVFRDRHHPAVDGADAVGLKGLEGVASAITKEKDLSELSLEELQSFSALITDDVFGVLTLEGSVNARNHIGGTAPQQVLAAVKAARARA